MQRFLRQSLLLSSTIPEDEFSQMLFPLLPKSKHTGSLADTMLDSTMPARDDNLQEWTIGSLGSSINLPKFSSRCVPARMCC